ncbi:MAG: lipoprotein signal peptidase [bacterium]
MKKKILPFVFLFALLIIDQVVKFYIKLNFRLGESVPVFDWFEILFVENPGMAFGVELGSKLFLTTFRILMSVGLFYYLWKLIKYNYKWGYITIVTMVLAGALGNIIDCVFYGRIFSESTYYTVATFMPEAGGYAPWFMGKVVDMLYFPLFTFPEWVPFCGGDIFFSPIFNVADSLISVSVISMILFYRNEFSESIERIFTKTKSVE